MGSKCINFEDLNFDKDYKDWDVYCHSKLAQAMFAYELQRRVKKAGKNIQIHLCHPGFSRTELVKEDARWIMTTMLAIITPLAQSAEQGSWPEVMCATEPGLHTETYYGPTQRMETVGAIGECPLEACALDQEAAAKLWQISEEKVGLKWSP
eukprot:gnl/MRDRNA2_/MRDRNA2_132391_c0_seq1.p1 gnl/MRDRNA2_/MRDRNA2_132391_c0~~gnl/MRDRNA2_/MRDRNA2_132391_c0_seq1.p1  ORF type:complete len:152 (+),score=28.51 gnl/MRDRNA2_/MRDRNA2_132391_c0_seq1:443-898(+)